MASASTSRWLAIASIGLLLCGCPRDAAETHRAPPSASALRIMPLGDSITEGGPGAATYRYWLQKELERRGVEIDYVGSRHGVYGGEPRYGDFDADHEGHWGWTAEEVAERIDEWAQAARADVVLLHLGSNDLLRAAGRIPFHLARIVRALREANAEVVVFLARLIPPAGFPTIRLRAVNDAIESLGHELSTGESPVIVVEQDDGFRPGAHTLDGVHPNEEGERRMAEKWAEAIDAWRKARRG